MFVELTLGVNFIDILRTNFLYESAFVPSPKPKRYQNIAAEMTFVQKIRS